MNCTHFIWDFDGTLFNSYPVMAAAAKGLLIELCIDEPLDIIISHMKISMGHAIQHYKCQYGLDDSFFAKYKELAEIYEKESLLPFDGITELCRSIHKNGGKNYLFTHRGDSAVFFINKFGLSESFADMITSKHGFPRKPSPDAIEYLIEKHGISKDDAIMIGDRDIDILSAKNAGIRSCYFSVQKETLDIADVNISGFGELYGIMDINRA